MPTIIIEVNSREYREVTAARGNRRYREILFEALDIVESPRYKAGRPPRREVPYKR